MNTHPQQPGKPASRRYHELRPAELDAMLAATPIAFWPLGMLEHHGWHLPIGFDGLKAEELCARIAAETGGVILPTMWWASGGGHGDFPWTHYQEPSAVADILVTTTRQLIANGFKIIVLLAGHYPWQPLLDEYLPAVAIDHLDIFLLWGSEATIGSPQVTMEGDHAAREETSSGLHLFPSLVDIAALTDSAERRCSWPGGREPSQEQRHPDVIYDATQAGFAQAGTDARLATAQHGRENLEPLIAHMAQIINAQIETRRRNLVQRNGHKPHAPNGTSAFTDNPKSREANN